MSAGQEEELAQEAHCHLEQLAGRFISPKINTVLHVRTGKPLEEILAEAKAENVDLIILPISSPSRGKRLAFSWKRFFAPAVAKTGQQLIRLAPCPVLIVHDETHFNCQDCWGSQPNPEPLSSTTRKLAA